MTPEIRSCLLQAKSEKRSVVLATKLPTGEQLILPDVACRDALGDAAAQALEQDRNETVMINGVSWFLHVQNLPLRLFVIGAVHIAQAVVRLAEPLGIAITVIDPRPALATTERFPGVTLMPEWPDEALELVKLDTRSAVVALTHDPKLDDPALDRALHSGAFYIGALGSRRSHASRLGRLSELGHDREALKRIKGPVGLPIAAVTAAEIALSILAEIVSVRRCSTLTWVR